METSWVSVWKGLTIKGKKPLPIYRSGLVGLEWHGGGGRGSKKNPTSNTKGWAKKKTRKNAMGLVGPVQKKGKKRSSTRALGSTGPRLGPTVGTGEDESPVLFWDASKQN